MNSSVSNLTASSREFFLDLLRVISVSLVIYGHFVAVGGRATRVPGIINDNTSLPILNLQDSKIISLECILELCTAQSAVIGVTLFFIITGYLMPMMIERHSRSSFLVNRVFRIFPTLIVATSITSLLVYLVQNLTFPSKSYLASWTLTYQFLKIVPVSGVLWTLVIEVLFYVLTAIIGTFTHKKIALLQLATVGLFCFSFFLTDGETLYPILKIIRYFLMIFIGSTIYLVFRSEKITKLTKTSLIISSTFFSLLAFTLFKFQYKDGSTYSSLGNHVISLVVFILALLAFRKGFVRQIPKSLTLLSELVYPLYLVHTTVGLLTMIALRAVVKNPYILVCAGTILSILVSYGLHRFIEQPSIRIGRNLIRKLFRPATHNENLSPQSLETT